MQYKRKIKTDILQILSESGIAKEQWTKLINKLVNYTDSVRTGQAFEKKDIHNWSDYGSTNI